MERPITVVRGPQNLRKQGASKVGGTPDVLGEFLVSTTIQSTSTALKDWGDEGAASSAMSAASRQGTSEAINDEDLAKKRGFLARTIFGGEDPAYASAQDRATSNVSARMSLEVAIAANDTKNASMTGDDFNKKILQPKRAEIDELYKGDQQSHAIAMERFNKGVTTATRQQTMANIKYIDEKRIRDGIATYSTESSTAVQMMQNGISADEREYGYQELIALGNSQLEGADELANLNYKTQSTIQMLNEDNVTQYKVWDEDGVFEDMSAQQQQAMLSAVSTYDTRHNSRMGETVSVGLNTALTSNSVKGMLGAYDKTLTELTKFKNESSGSDKSRRNYQTQRGKLLRARKALEDKAAKQSVVEMESTLRYAAEMQGNRIRGEADEASLGGGTKKGIAGTDDLHMQDVIYNYMSEDQKQNITQRDLNNIAGTAVVMSLQSSDAATAFGARFANNQRVPVSYVDGLTAQLQVLSQTRTDTGMLTTNAKSAIDNIKAVNKASGGRLFKAMGNADVARFGALDKYRDFNQEQHDAYSKRILDGTTVRANPKTLGYGNSQDMSQIIENTFQVRDSASQAEVIELLQTGMDISDGHGGQAMQYAKDMFKLNHSAYQGTLLRNAKAGTDALQQEVALNISKLPREVMAVIDEEGTMDGIPQFNITDILKRVDGTDEFQALLEQAFTMDAGYRSLSDIKGGYNMAWDSDVNGLVIESTSMRGYTNLVIHADQLIRAYSGAVMTEVKAKNKIIEQQRFAFAKGEKMTPTTGMGTVPTGE